MKLSNLTFSQFCGAVVCDVPLQEGLSTNQLRSYYNGCTHYTIAGVSPTVLSVVDAYDMALQRGMADMV